MKIKNLVNYGDEKYFVKQLKNPKESTSIFLKFLKKKN